MMLKDWDATEPLLLVDKTCGGRPRKLLVQAIETGSSLCWIERAGSCLLGKPFTIDLGERLHARRQAHPVAAHPVAEFRTHARRSDGLPTS